MQTASISSTARTLKPKELIDWGFKVLETARDSLGHLQDVPPINSKFNTEFNSHTLHLPGLGQELRAITLIADGAKNTTPTHGQISFEVWKINRSKCKPSYEREFQMTVVPGEHNQSGLAAALVTRIKHNKR